MKRLLVLMLLSLLALGVGVSSEDHVSLQAAPAGEALESGDGPFLVEISNPARDEPEAPGYGGNRSTAIGISAELISRDQRIEVLSGPQQVGSLAAGEAKTAEFMVQVEQDAGVGVYPMDLALSYQQLAGVEVKGDPHFPEVYFQYERSDQTVPLEARVVLGSRMVIEVKGSARPGEVSEIELVVQNRGDLAAVDAVIALEPKGPFNLTEGGGELGTLEPGDRASARFKMAVDESAPPGQYPASCNLSYLSGRTPRQKERAVLLEVKRNSYWGMAVGGAALLAVIGLTAVYLRDRMEIPGLGRRRSGRRKW